MRQLRNELVWALAFAAGGVAAVAGADPYEQIITTNEACNVYFWEGVGAMGEVNMDLARTKFQAALNEDEGCFLAYLLLSQIEYFEGNDTESTEYLQKIPAEPPELTALYDDIARALRADDYEEVAAHAQRLVAAYPQTMSAIAALHLLARAQYYLGRRTEAIEAFEAAYLYSGLAPGTVPAYASRAEAEEFEKFAGVR